MRVIKKITIVFFIFLFHPIIGQQYSFVPFSVEDGLSQTQIYSICPDKDGNLWIATAGGVSKFNGKKFLNYSKKNGLADNAAVQIIQYKDYIWVATKHGITRIRGKQMITLNLLNYTDGNPINNFTFDHQGDLWLGVQNIGLIQLEVTSSDVFSVTYKKTHTPIKDVFFTSLICDSKGKIWIGGKQYLGCYVNNKWINIDLPDSELGISDIEEDKDGKLWISTYEEGVYQFDIVKNSFKNYNKDDGLISPIIRDVFIDSKNNIWLSSKIGISCIVNGQIKTYQQHNGLVSENVKIISEDLEENIWIGTDGSGIYRFAGEEFVNFNKKTGLPSDYIMSITQDFDNNYWFSTYDGGFCYFDQKKNQVKSYNTTNSKLSNNTVWTSITTRDSSLWFGTGSGLIQLKNGNLNSYENLDWLPSDKITALHEDDLGRLWVGCSKGIAIIDGELKFCFNNQSEFFGRNIRCIKQFDNYTYAGSRTGLFVFDKELNSKKASFNDIFDEDPVYCLEKYKDSLLFIGTGNGLYAYNKAAIYKLDIHSSF